MNGRYPTRGRGGRGGRRGRKPYYNERPKEVKKKTIEEYYFYVGSSKQASDYENTNEFIVNHIKKTFDRGNDVAEAIRTLVKIDTDTWKPRLQSSTDPDDDIKKLEDRQYEMEYKAELNEALGRKRMYNDNLFKAYALIWERCAKAMQNKISARSDFETRIYNNPIELMRAIKEHALNYQESRYEMAIIADAMRTVTTTKQRDNESLQDYTRRFKTAREILESHIGGPLILTKYVKTMDLYDATDPDVVETLINKASEQFFAHIYMENSDQEKYGSISKNLNEQKSLGNDQYPKTIVDTNNVLSNHKFDNFKVRHEQKPTRKPYNNQKNNDAKDKSEEDSPKLSFAQMEGRCYCCGKPGHRSPDCRSKDKTPRDEWAINKSQSHAGAAKPEETNSLDGDKSTVSAITDKSGEAHVGWAGVHMSFMQHTNMKDMILLDSDSTDTIFCNPEYVTNIHDTKEELKLGTNGGVMVSQQKCDVPHLGTHWFNKASITNIISLAEMAKRYKVTYDSGKEKAFHVHMPNKIVKFGQMKNGLYGMNPKDDDTFIKTNKAGNIQMLNTAEENFKFLSPRQQLKVKAARKLYHAVGTPTVDDLKSMIRMNLIRNNVVTTADVNLATKTFGPDIGAIKGKTTRTRPVPVVSNIIEIPDELLELQKDLTMSLDGMTVNSLKFLTTISHDLMYRTAQYVQRNNATNYESCLDEIMAIYNRGLFTITEIHCDNEFHKVLDPYSAKQNPQIRMNYAAAQEHVPRAERNNRTIKERVRATYHALPYEHLPRTVVKYLVSEATKKLNFFPNKNGVSKHYSPRMIVHQENLDFDRHCKHAFGEYVLAHDEPDRTNMNAPRALDCIYLRPTATRQGGHELLHLQTNAVVTRRKCTAVPLTPSIIKQVHKIASDEGMPQGLKVTNRTGITLFDSAWIAGVDYENEEFDDEMYEEEEQEGEDDEDEDEQEAYDEMDENELADILDTPIPFQAPNQEHQPDEIIAPNDQEDNEDQEDGAYDEEPEDANEENEPDVANVELEEDAPNIRRSQRIRVPNPRYQHLQESTARTEEYSTDSAIIIASTMNHLNFMQTYSLKKGIEKFGTRGRVAAHKEMKQLHDRTVFVPIRIKDMEPQERKRAMESLIFLVEKRDGTVKARTCANGSTQRAYIPREEAASPTAATEAILITGVIEAKQRRDVMTLDIPNAFVQTNIPTSGEKVVMKIRGELVNILTEICPGVYDDYVLYEGKHKVLYVRMIKALYGMMIASILYYKKFRRDIEEIGFEVNPYDICVANRIVRGKQHTVTWHVDDLKSSHEDKTVNDEFHKWCEGKYGSDTVGHVKVVRGKTHDYLAMILDYSKDGALKVDMKYYIDGMIEDFPYDLNATKVAPWSDKLLKIDEKSKELDDARQGIFHTFVMKAMFLCKRGRPDVNPGIGFLSSRVKKPLEQDWNKLLKVLGFLKGTREDVLTLEADDTQKLTWYIDAAFAVHNDMRSHTGAVFTMGKGAITSDSTKQKTNTRSSTEAELHGIDDKISKVLWTKRFIEAQNFKVKLNIVYQDNTSTMKLAKNARASAGKRTRHFDIKMFYVTDLIDRDELTVEYCPTGDMIADYMTKALVGAKFRKFRDLIMNLSNIYHRIGQQECVGRHNKKTIEKESS